MLAWARFSSLLGPASRGWKAVLQCYCNDTALVLLPLQYLEYLHQTQGLPKPPKEGLPAAPRPLVGAGGRDGALGRPAPAVHMRWAALCC